jgi:hypothetical protein
VNPLERLGHRMSVVPTHGVPMAARKDHVLSANRGPRRANRHAAAVTTGRDLRAQFIKLVSSSGSDRPERPSAEPPNGSLFVSAFTHKERANMNRKNTICLWFDKDAHEAARFYAATFPDSEVTAVHEAPGDYPGGKEGDVLTVEFTDSRWRARWSRRSPPARTS